MPDFSPVQQVSRARIERDVRLLSTKWPTRHTFSRHHDAVADWCAGRIKECGLSPETHLWRRSGMPERKNVTATLPQSVRTARLPWIFLTAHFDSRQQDAGNAEALAPGANDNATGVAVALEVARLLTPMRRTTRVRICLFSGEEQGLWGSEAYASDLKLDAPLTVFNLDQIGYPPKSRAIVVERDLGGVAKNNASSDRIATRIEVLAKTIAKVPTVTDRTWGSDYLPFEAKGHTIVGLYEAGKDYPQYHSDTDTPDRVDFAYVADMAKLALATLIDLTDATATAR